MRVATAGSSYDEGGPRDTRADGRRGLVAGADSAGQTRGGWHRARSSPTTEISERSEHSLNASYEPNEPTVQQREARLHAILESALDALVTIDLEGRIVEFNSAAEQLFGWPRAAVIGRELASVLVPERLRERHRRGLAKYRATGQGAILGRRIEMPALRSDGREFPAELTVMPVGFDDPSAPALFSATLRDVTAQKQAAYIDARLAAIVASADDAILSTELDGTILSWNAGAERTYGYSADEVIGLTVDRLAPAHLSGEFVSLVQRVMRGESVHQYETERLRKDGRQIVIALTVSLVRLPNGDVAGVSAIGRDITSQKHAEDERRRLERQILEARHWESLGVLAGGIAHDFNNLLVGILGNAELVATQLPPGSPLRETLEQIEASANRAAELTRQMLAYAGKGRYVIQTVALNEVVGDMVGLMQSAISTPATLQIALGRAVPPIAADVGQLRQVILGIITNSNEALGGGGGVIRVKTGELEVGTNGQADYEWSERLAPGRFAVLDVADTGPGMDQATLARVFEPFFTTKFTGRGLGLAAIQGIVRSHGGAIGVTSELGAGTTFRLLFPALPELLAG